MEYLGGGSALDLVCMIILDCYVVFRDGWEITKFKNLNGIIQCSEKDKNSEIGLANFKPEAYLKKTWNWLANISVLFVLYCKEGYAPLSLIRFTTMPATLGFMF